MGQGYPGKPKKKKNGLLRILTIPRYFNTVESFLVKLKLKIIPSPFNQMNYSLNVKSFRDNSIRNDN